MVVIIGVIFGLGKECVKVFYVVGVKLVFCGWNGGVFEEFIREFIVFYVIKV